MHLADANAALEILLTPVLMAIVEMSEHCIVLRAELLRGHPLSIQRLLAREVLRMMSARTPEGRLERTDLQIERLLSLLAQERQGIMLQLGAGIEAHRDRGSICIRRVRPAPRVDAVAIVDFGVYTFGDWRLEIQPSVRNAGEKRLVGGVLDMDYIPDDCQDAAPWGAVSAGWWSRFERNSASVVRKGDSETPAEHGPRPLR